MGINDVFSYICLCAVCVCFSKKTWVKLEYQGHKIKVKVK